MASKIDTKGIDDIRRRLERTADVIDRKRGTKINPKKTRTFTRGGPYLHTGDNEEESAQFERDHPEEFAYWREFFQRLGDIW